MNSRKPTILGSLRWLLVPPVREIVREARKGDILLPGLLALWAVAWAAAVGMAWAVLDTLLGVGRQPGL